VAPVVRTLALTRPAAGRRDIGEMIERKEVVKGYEFDRGQFVTFHALRAEGPRYRELADDRVVGPVTGASGYTHSLHPVMSLSEIENA
jgi:hypothetical protein